MAAVKCIIIVISTNVTDIIINNTKFEKYEEIVVIHGKNC